MANPKFDTARASRVLVDAVQLGDAEACARHKITPRTLQRYRERLAADDTFVRATAERAVREEKDWREPRRRFLKTALAKLTELIETVDYASPEHIEAISEAIERVGNLDVASVALVGDIDDPASEAPAEDAGDDASGDRPAASPH